jgi:hypothetical protein
MGTQWAADLKTPTPVKSAKDTTGLLNRLVSAQKLVRTGIGFKKSM